MTFASLLELAEWHESRAEEIEARHGIPTMSPPPDFPTLADAAQHKVWAKELHTLCAAFATSFRVSLTAS